MRILTKRQTRKLIAAFIILLAGFISAHFGLFEEGLKTARQSQPGLYEVEEVSDGDTIIVNMNGTREIIRMIGVDTPETHHPDRPVECYGQAASDYSRELLAGKKVRLQADPLNTNRDRYDRLLRYVYLPDGTLAEAKLIAEGYGFSYTQFPFEKTDEFNTYEQQARDAKRGLWASCQVIITENGARRTNPAVN